ncbi:MAG TPA: carboxypeptidase-like regulatory domain-containing protein [Thermoanaerobaculia bacterium]|nr:carboxypeptidase-like regulatory domain-containing protein [Thermoanaerobaculia bacterium]
MAVAALIAIPVAAQKRRAVRHPSAGTPFQATVTGSVLDAATEAPVRSATVKFAGRTEVTNDQGTFTFVNATGFGAAAVTVSRSGYQEATQTVSTAGTHTLTFRLVSKPTVTVRLTNGSTRTVDYEESSFGYSQLFGGYIAVDSFCRPDGSQVVLTTAQMKRLVGPATQATVTACCNFPVEKVRLELRSGETADMSSAASCAGYTIDFIARDHSGGQFTYTKLTDVAEIVFP